MEGIIIHISPKSLVINVLTNQIRNHWGSHWGENGYARLALNKNTCNIVYDPIYTDVIRYGSEETSYTD